MNGPPRKIIHIDMDAFFAAIEQRDNPNYRNKPIIVGGSPNSRGVVATCSYEARKYGVHSAMPSARAYQLCPQAIFVKPRFAAYQEASAIIRKVFSRYCDCFEPVALDEAYLDVSDLKLFQGSATLLAKQIKQDIFQETQLIASAGISYNKFLAKIASDMGKPNGLFLIRPEQGGGFVESLAIGQFHGIGKQTERRMQEMGIYTGKDLQNIPLARMQEIFGSHAQFFYDIARGQDFRPVKAHRLRKSLGAEITFEQDINDVDVIYQCLLQLLEKILAKLHAHNLQAYTLTIKVKYQNFVQITRGRTLAKPVGAEKPTLLLIMELLKQTDAGNRKVRLVGLSLSGLRPQDAEPQYQQLDLFE